MILSQPVASESAMDPKLLIAAVYVFALAAFLGYQVISRVPPLLHTPLMSATNAISGISLVGSLVIAGSDRFSQGFPSVHLPVLGKINAAQALGFLAVTTAMINVVGGFMITDRMLKMFKKKEGGR
jgi:NAD(P) transhydrogenase subunit alpha